MIFELVYTSAPRGLRAGSRGFCSVAFTSGMPANLVEQAESLSGYRHIYSLADPNYAQNPVAYSHFQFVGGGQRWSYLSRISAYPADYSGRSNKLAHHIMLSGDELQSQAAECGPARLMQQIGFFREEWNAEPCELSPGSKPIRPVPRPPDYRAEEWKRVTGDAGWAGVLAEWYMEDMDRPTYIRFAPASGVDRLALISEAIELLPPERRWSVTFSTYFSDAPHGTSCAWRFVLPDFRIPPGSRTIDLSKPSTVQSQGGLIHAARTGDFPKHASIPRNPTHQVATPQDGSAARGAIIKPNIRQTPAHEQLQSGQPPRGRDRLVSGSPSIASNLTGQQSRSYLIPAVIASCIFVSLVGLYLIWRFLLSHPGAPEESSYGSLQPIVADESALESAIQVRKVSERSIQAATNLSQNDLVAISNVMTLAEQGLANTATPVRSDRSQVSIDPEPIKSAPSPESPTPAHQVRGSNQFIILKSSKIETNESLEGNYWSNVTIYSTSGQLLTPTRTNINKGFAGALDAKYTFVYNENTLLCKVNGSEVEIIDTENKIQFIQIRISSGYTNTYWEGGFSRTVATQIKHNNQIEISFPTNCIAVLPESMRWKVVSKSGAIKDAQIKAYEKERLTLSFDPFIRPEPKKITSKTGLSVEQLEKFTNNVTIAKPLTAYYILCNATDFPGVEKTSAYKGLMNHIKQDVLTLAGIKLKNEEIVEEKDGKPVKLTPLEIIDKYDLNTPTGRLREPEANIRDEKRRNDIIALKVFAEGRSDRPGLYYDAPNQLNLLKRREASAKREADDSVMVKTVQGCLGDNIIIKLELEPLASAK